MIVYRALPRSAGPIGFGMLKRGRSAAWNGRGEHDCIKPENSLLNHLPIAPRRQLP